MYHYGLKFDGSDEGKTLNRTLRDCPDVNLWGKTVCTGQPILVQSGGTLRGVGYATVIKALPDFGDNPVVTNAHQHPQTEAEMDQGISVQNLRIDGNAVENTTAQEWSDCLQLFACKNSIAENLWLENPKGDGVAIGRPWGVDCIPSGLALSNIFVKNAQRNGLSITSGKNITIGFFKATSIGHHGIDLENNNETDVVEGVDIISPVIWNFGLIAPLFDCGIAVANDSGSFRGISILGGKIFNQFGNAWAVGFRGVEGLIVKGLVGQNLKYGICELEGAPLPTEAIINSNYISNAEYGIIVRSQAGSIVTANFIKNVSNSLITIGNHILDNNKVV